MRPIIRTAVLALAAVGTAALGLAAPAARASVTPAATCTVCSIVIFTGGYTNGVPAYVGPPSLPDTIPAPETIKAGTYTLQFNVADLQGLPWGACMSDCSEWQYTASPTQVYVPNFTANGTTEHGLKSVEVYNSPRYWVKDPDSLGAGVWTPTCLQAEGHSIKLDLNNYEWSVGAC